MGDIEIRSLKLGDTESATKYLYKAIKESDTYKHQDISKKKIAQTVTAAIMGDYNCIFGAFKENRIVGMLGGVLDVSWFSDTITLSDMGVYVDEEYRNTGVSYKLFYKWFEFGKNNGAKEVVFSLTAEKKYFKKMHDSFKKKFNFELMGILLRRK